MSKLGQLRKKWNYETNAPCCRSCIHFKGSMVYLRRDSIPKQTNPLCKAGNFTVAPNSICDRWTGADGSTLAPEAVS